MEPILSSHYAKREPSVIRMAQMEFARRRDAVEAINVAIGNVSLPMHPAMIERLAGLKSSTSPFAGGVVKYTATVGEEETRRAFLNIIASSGCDTAELSVQITEGGSQAMELALVGVCGPAGSSERPLLVIDPTYTNYTSFAERLGRSTVSIRRTLRQDGFFTLPDFPAIERTIRERQPGALLVIPYDNPTGQLYTREMMSELAGLCVRYNLWMISDEAYRELNYTDGESISIWSLSEEDVPGIQGRRISVESSSKVWNACGLRIGALVTDSEEFHRRAVAENTANLCPNAIGQYIFGALAHESHRDLRAWYEKQRSYYQKLSSRLTAELKRLVPGILVSSPSAAIYSVVDVRDITETAFSALDFVMYCAREGSVAVEGAGYTLLVAPMSGFYAGVDEAAGQEGRPNNSPARGPGEVCSNPGSTQMRIAYVESPERMALVPALFKELLHRYQARR